MDALSVLHYAKNLLYFWSIYLHNSKKSCNFVANFVSYEILYSDLTKNNYTKV